MIVGGFVLHLYCDTPGCPQGSARPTSDGGSQAPGEFTHPKNEAGAFAAARRAGWVLVVTSGQCYCRDCAKPKVNNQ